MDKEQINELRELLVDYLGSAAVSMENDGRFMCNPAAAELFTVDNMSDEEVIETARDLGLIPFEG